MHLKKFLIALILFPALLNGSDLRDYIEKYRLTKEADFDLESGFINNYTFDSLVTEVSIFYMDSLPYIRRKAYYLTHKKGLISDLESRQKSIKILLSGCNDNNGSVVGQNISYLQEYLLQAFDEGSKKTVESLLVKKQLTHRKGLILLAGYLNAGEEYMRKELLMPATTKENRWQYSLALARMGSEEQAKYIGEVIHKVEVNNDLISYVLPDLIYTRDRELIGYCIDIVYSDEKNCFSPNPDKPEKILCGYRVLELLAPVIKDFPVPIDAMGVLKTDDYQLALEKSREWLKSHPDFILRKDIY